MIKQETVIKEILKPPFKMNGLFLLIADQYRKKNKAANKLIKFIESSVDEKWERKFGESLRWRIDISDFGDSIECPNCEENFIYDCYDARDSERFNFCPSCGIRLLFSEEEAK